MRIVVDTSVVVSGIRSQLGASFALLRIIAAGELEACVTGALFLEYETVLKRDGQLRASGLSLADVDDFLSAFAGSLIGIETYFKWRPQLRDPNDEMVLEAAVNGRVDAIVTHNLRDFATVTPKFGIEAMLPRDLLKRMRT